MRAKLATVAAGRLSEALLTLAQIRIVTELLSVAEYGRYALLTALIVLCNLVFLSAPGSFVLRQAEEWRREGRLVAEFSKFTMYLLVLPMAALPFLLLSRWSS